MSDQPNSKQGPEQSGSLPSRRGPTHEDFVEQEGKDGKTYLRKIGVAFSHKEGTGLNHDLFAAPLGRKMITLPIKDRLERQRQGKKPVQRQEQERGQ